MMTITQEKVKGNKFEIWLEKILKIQGYQNVLRNVQYHKARYVYRQADISYNIIRNNSLKLILVEAKYSSNGNINYHFRGGKKKKSGQVISTIDNLVDEVLERQKFIGADASILVTNKQFDKKVKYEASKKGIKLLEGDNLQKLYLNLGYKKNINDSIANIDLNNHNLYSNIIYL